MARYNNVLISAKICPKGIDRKVTADMKPGTLAVLSSGEYVPHAADGDGANVQLYILQEGYVQGRDITYNVLAGETGTGIYPVEDNVYGVLLADTINVASVDTPLTSNGAGALRLAVVGVDDILFYSNEIYNNTTGATQLLAVRKA